MTSDTRSTDEIEREIERERSQLGDTLDDLQDRFSLEGMARQVSEQWRTNGRDIGRSVVDSVRENPMAVAVTGIGLAWMIFGGRDRPRHETAPRGNGARFSSDRFEGPSYGTSSPATPSTAAARPVGNGVPTDATRRTPSWARTDDDDDNDGGGGMSDRAYDAAQGAKNMASSAAQGVSDTAQNAGESVASGAKSARDSVAGAGRAASERAARMRERVAQGTEHLSEEARDRVIAARERAVEARDAAQRYGQQGADRAVDFFEDQPLVAGALALAVGAALGAALPRTSTEDEYLGEHSDNLVEEAERIFDEEKAKIGHVAEAARDEAQKVAQETRGEAEQAVTKVSDEVKSMGERVAKAAESEADKQKIGDPTSKPKS